MVIMVFTIGTIHFHQAHADIWSELGGAIMGFKKTLVVESVEVQPSLATDSYFLVYGKDTSTGKLSILEIQLNTLTVYGNFDDGLGGELNRDMLKYVVEHNIGNTITFECNGFDKALAFMEEYPQCYKIVNIVKNNTSESNDDVKFLKSELKKATDLAIEQSKIILNLSRK